MLLHYGQRIFQLKAFQNFIQKSGGNILQKLGGMKRNSLGSPTSRKIKPSSSVMGDDHVKSSIIQDARPYQVEILEQSIKENTIVCLGTGTGKTFISVMLIREKQGQIKGKLSDGGKRTFFLVNTVPLAEQQARAIKENTTLNVKFYTGDMGVDFWDKEKWRKEFDENEVLVMTAQILVNLLTHGYFTPLNINLLIMDECHNANKKHPYAQLMELFPISNGPHVMGLTASIINEKYKKSPDKESIKMFLDDRMKSLEATLRSKCITCSDPEATSKFAAKPVEEIYQYSTNYDINDCYNMNTVIVAMEEKLDEASEKFDCQKKRAKDNRQMLFSRVDYSDVINRTSRLGLKDACAIAADAVKYCSQIITSLGPMSTYEAIKILLEQLEKHKKRFSIENGKVLDECSKIFQTFIRKYEDAARKEGFHNVDNVIPMEPFITRKAHNFLKDILREEKLNFEKQDRDLHAIVFVQRRCTAIVLSKLINRMAESDREFDGITSEYVLGHGLDANVRLADSFMRSSEQSKILNRFKSVDFNVLVATSVVEEGLDVRKCNLVVRFDGINNYREYAQSKGRARQKDSKFIIMASEDEYPDMSQQLTVMQRIESVLFSECQNRELPNEDEILEQMYDEINEYVETIKSGNAQIKPHYAVSLLYMYCGFLQQDKYSNTNPYFRFHKYDQDRTVKAECILPLNFPLDQKVFESDWLPDKEIAKKSVASEICKQLADAGELTKENLLPVDHRRDGLESDSDDGDDGPKTTEGTRKSRQKYLRKIPSALRRSLDEDGFDVYVIDMTLTAPYDNPNATATWPLWYGEQEGFGIILPANTYNMPTFKLYSKSGEITVTFKKLDVTAFNITPDKLQQIEQFNQTMCQSFFRHFVSPDSYILFDRDDANISKGLVVPLTRDVIDYDVMRSVINDSSTGKFASSIGDQQAVIRKTYLGPNINKKLYYVTGISEKKASDYMEGKTTFVQYYAKKYSVNINADAYMLQVVPSFHAVRFKEIEDEKNSKKISGGHSELLVPELCVIANPLSAQLHMKAKILPYVLFRLECSLNAEEFKGQLISSLDLDEFQEPMDTNDGRPMHVLDKMENLLQPVCSSAPTNEEILEALTTRQALLGVDLERLEMLGDAFLKQAVSIYVFFKHPTIDEGRMTKIRKRIISNKHLLGIGANVDVPDYMNNSHFGVINPQSENKNPVTVWLPPCFKRESVPDLDDYFQSYAYQEIQDKSIADCVEALIGVFFKTGGVDGCLKFMDSVLKIPVLYQSIEDASECRVKRGSMSNYADFPKAASAIRRVDRGDSELARMQREEDEVKDLYERGRLKDVEKILNYTFNDKSHLIQAMTHLSYGNFGNFVTGCYQEYEFLGDAIIDFLVTLHVYAGSNTLSPGKLTSIKSALVNNNIFSFHIIGLGLHKYLLQSSPQLLSELREFLNAVTDENGVLYPELYKSPFIVAPPNSECGLISPKVFGDILESLAGAIFLDSGLNVLKVWEVFYPIMGDIIDKYTANVPLNPKREMHETFSNLKFDFPEDSKTKEMEMKKCVITFGDGQSETGLGKNSKTAKIMACQRALQKLKNQN